MKLTYEINISEKDLGLDYKYDVGTSSLDLMFLNENGFRMEFAVLPGNNNIDEIQEFLRFLNQEPSEENITKLFSRSLEQR